MDLLELNGIDLSFDRTQVLHGIDLAVREGEFLTLLGPSGSGKSTILRLIGGFLSADRGSILLRGSDISHVPVNRRPFNTVFQDYALFPHMNVAANVAYGPRVQGRYDADMRGRISEVIATVGLSGFEERMPAALSGGQRQRVALARAIVCQPQIILLDEPLSALDAELRHQMQDFLKELQRRLGITFVFVTHDQSEAIVLSDRIVVLNNGRIEQIGTPREVYYKPAREFVAGFFGDNNLLAGDVAAFSETRTVVNTAMGVIVCAGRPPASLKQGAPVKVAIRPEALRREGFAADCASVEVTVQRVTFVGAISRIEVAAKENGVPLRWVTPIPANEAPPAPGDNLTLYWGAEDAVAVSLQ
ncbi:MAG: ABC transporter ATP-binding protein [Bauldia sp.]|nr:ABC transporter ATP-binding protein [Bauldia sp.]